MTQTHLHHGISLTEASQDGDLRQKHPKHRFSLTGIRSGSLCTVSEKKVGFCSLMPERETERFSVEGKLSPFMSEAFW